MRQLPRRILASAVLSVAAAGGLLVGGVLLGRPMIRDAAVETMASTTNQAACEAEPATWGADWGGFSLFAYDVEGVSRNPNAPPIERDMLDRALRKGGPIRTTQPDDQVVAVMPMAGGGPCAVLRMASMSPDAKAMRLFLAILSVTTLAGMMLAGVGVTMFVVLPFRQRVQRISDAASGVGREGFTTTDSTDDALGNISTILADSHARIVETQTALEERNRALADHLAGIAHDLRTPLASMLLSLEAVADEADGPLHDVARRALTDAVYLSTLVDNLHQGTRLRNDFDVTEGLVDLTELVTRLAQRFGVLGRHAGVAVASHAPDGPVWAACSPTLAERAIANLVHNAVQHQRGDGHVAIVLQVDEAAGRFTIVVDDDGPGLPTDLLASLRVESFRLDAARQRGPGLGMVISSEIARRAGWTLTWHPLEPRGTQARVTGPVAGTSHGSSSGAGSPSGPEARAADDAV